MTAAFWHSQLDRIARQRFDPTFEDAFDVPTAWRALACDGQGALTGGVHGHSAVLLGEPYDTEHGPVPLRLLIASHGAARDLGNVRPKSAGPIRHSLRRPLAIVLLLARAMLGIGHRCAGTRIAAAVGATRTLA